MTPTGVLLVTPIFLWGVGLGSLLSDRSRVALALHNARCGTPFWVTKKFFPWSTLVRMLRLKLGFGSPPAAVDCTRTGSLL